MSVSFNSVAETRSVQVSNASYTLSSFPSNNAIKGNFNALTRLANYEKAVLRDEVLKEELLAVYAACVQRAYIDRTSKPAHAKCLVLCASSELVELLVPYLNANLRSVRSCAVPEGELELSDASVDIWVGHRAGRGIFWGLEGLMAIVSNTMPMVKHLVALLHHTVQGGSGQLVLLHNSDDLMVPAVTPEMVNS